MRASNYRKKLHIDKKIWKTAGIALSVLAVSGIIFFFVYFKVENVEIMGSSHYTEEEIKEMILRGPMASNSVLAPILYSTDDAGDIPFVEGFSVSQLNRNTIVISVKEKQPVGCIPYLDSYIYFDRNGIFIESSKEREESVPYFDGIQVDYVIKGEKLPIKGTTVLNTAVALATIFQKNEMIPDHIEFDNSYQISLVYGDITVQLGKDEYLEDKMARVIAIMPKLSGKKGILHLETVNDNSKTITFEEEFTFTAENWPGGYDENGYYTGYDEYDEEGNYVGPKPDDSSGDTDEATDETLDGTTDGALDGTTDGTLDGTTDGALDGTTDGTLDGTTDGALDETAAETVEDALGQADGEESQQSTDTDNGYSYGAYGSEGY